MADTGRCNDHARPHQQRQVQLQPGDIEGDGGDGQHTVARAQCQLVFHCMQEIEQIAMADLHALGRTGGAGGVQHVRGAVGRRQRCDCLRQHGRARIQPDHATEQIALAQRWLADQANGTGIVEHLAVACGRALRIQRQIRRPAPHHRQQRHQQVFAARQRHRDHIARAHAIGHPLRSDARGKLAQRGVVERAVVVLRNHGRRHQLGALQHAVQQRGRFRQRRCGVVPGMQQTPALAIAEHIDLAQRAFRIGQYRVGQMGQTTAVFGQLLAVVQRRVGIQIETQRCPIAAFVAEDGEVIGRAVGKVMRHRVRLAEAQGVVEGLDVHRQACELLLHPEHAQIAAHVLEAILLMAQCMPNHRRHLREQGMDGLLRVHLQAQRNHVGHQACGLPVARIDAAGHRHRQHQILGTGAAVVVRGNQRNQHLRQAGAVLLAQRAQTHHLLRRELPGAAQQPGGQLIARPRQRRRRRQIGQLLHPVLAIALEPIGVAIVLFHFEQRQCTAVLRRRRLHVGQVGVIEHGHALHHDRRAIAVHHQMTHALHPQMMILAKTEHRAMP